jgi:hypothetical protein
MPPLNLSGMQGLRTCFKKRSSPLRVEHLRHMWSTVGGVGGAISL